MAIVAKNLCKKFNVLASRNGNFGKAKDYFFPRYHKVEIVKDLSFTISPGECVGLVGPNGAGKSTTIKMLIGILHPTSGTVTILGKNPHKERKSLAKEISVLFGQCSKLWLHLSILESLTLLASIYDLSNIEFTKQKNYLIDLFEIGPLIRKTARQLSLGERMRCELAATFLHNPKVVFLDEPTIGLDILAKARMRNLLRTMCEELKCTFFLTSHDTDDFENACNRMILIKNGTLILDNSIQNMKKTAKKKIVTLTLGNDEKPLEQIKGASLIFSAPFQLKYEIDSKHTPFSQILSQLIAKYNVKDISIDGPSLESIIQTYYTNGK